MSAESPIAEPQLRVSHLTEGALKLKFSGSWRLQSNLPSPAQMEKEILSEPSVRRITFDTEEITEWDTGLLVCLITFTEHCKRRHIDIKTMKEGVSGELATRAQAVLKEAQTTLLQARKLVTTLDDTVAQNAKVGYDSANTLAEITATARSLRILAEFLERNPDAILRGKVVHGR